MTIRISIDSQIAIIDKYLAASVPESIARRHSEHAVLARQQLAAVRETLVFCRDNREAIRRVREAVADAE